MVYRECHSFSSFFVLCISYTFVQKYPLRLLVPRGSRASGRSKPSNSPQKEDQTQVQDASTECWFARGIRSVPHHGGRELRHVLDPRPQNVRTLYFTPSLGSPVTVSSDANTTVTLPSEYSGNFYAVKQGAIQEVGMLGEVMFNGWMGLTYFDVSAIVNPGDRDNVKQMWPAKSLVPVPGCQMFPCDNVYYKDEV
ncbi:hypothetical protein B0J13DRAFT_571786 [Dactylonectria estremocensis]|uniref:Uncharacterized protein n=1 Tax=Dactylonectria estremocensis TaxID=1079267 RepID=A0A9P9IBU4_9HYPO|nr:hypothetical protein B0J13DRAFT_571786 [Dactylonectria estremocensis]